MAESLLAEGLARINAGLGQDLFADRLEIITKLLETYIAEIELFNQVYGLVKVKDRDELVVKHILDSLSPLGALASLPVFAEQSGEITLADVGSGAGLPGIPLAIALPRLHVTLIERMGRRAGFLRNVQAILALPNIEVAEGEMEKQKPGMYDIIAFRAFHPLEGRLLGALERLLKPKGVLAAYKGRMAAIQAETEPLDLTGRWEVIPCPVPFLDEERHLLLISRGGDGQPGETSKSQLK